MPSKPQLATQQTTPANTSPKAVDIRESSASSARDPDDWRDGSGPDASDHHSGWGDGYAPAPAPAPAPVQARAAVAPTLTLVPAAPGPQVAGGQIPRKLTIQERMKAASGASGAPSSAASDGNLLRAATVAATAAQGAPVAQPAQPAQPTLPAPVVPVVVARKLTLKERLEAMSADSRSISAPVPAAQSRMPQAPVAPVGDSFDAAPVDVDRQKAERALRHQENSTSALADSTGLAPVGYPDVQAWPSNAIAPGSKYSEDEWNAARTNEVGKACDVLEMQSPYNSWLVSFIKPEEIIKKTIEFGKSKTTTEAVYPPEVKLPGLMGLVAQMFSDCIWVSNKALPDFPSAREGQCDLGGVPYQIIRPRADYLEPDRAYRVNAKITIPVGFGSDLGNEPNSEGEGEVPVCAPAP